MTFDLSFLGTALWTAAAKIPATLALAAVPLALGTLLGLPLALARFFRVPVLGKVIQGAVTLIKGIPVVLMLFVFYVVSADAFDPLMQSLGLSLTFRDFPKSLIALAALSIYAAAALCEVFRGALAAVPPGQFDAAAAAGLTRAQVLRRIVLPQALPVSLPMVSNITIALLKAAAMGSVVAVVDVMNAAVIAANANYRYLEAYVAAALIYWGLCFALEKAFGAGEKVLTRRVRRAA
ncbi:MAG: ABC transporter permease subunit [Oscillospiraceae bacterium]|jgi:L-cystine transport system permease protein|nr:ABC transporter permease subunit [Oscillospiraceae bacterium]